MELILASQSPRRRDLLSLMGLTFQVIVSGAEESAPSSSMGPDQLVEHNALEKALAVARQRPDACVLGADTVVVLGQTILGKPRDAFDARSMLSSLQGRTHTVFTGIALVHRDRVLVRSDSTDVTFSPMSPDEINWYVGSGEPLDKAGAYGIQGLGGMFVERIDGNYFTVMGLSLPLVYDMLRDIGYFKTTTP